jgi:gluconokinase
MDERLAAGESAVVTCSALRRAYRDLLRENRPAVRFCELDAPPDLIADRLQHRTGHYMPPSLLPSQLATLEPLADDEPGVHISVAATPEEIVRDAISALGLEDNELADNALEDNALEDNALEDKEPMS